MAIRIFISYAREDKAFADRLYEELVRHPDLSPWIDTRHLLAGVHWKDEIFTEIATSDFILIILSNRSISKDGFFQREMREAIERLSLLSPSHRVIIPVRTEQCEPQHRELRLLNYLDLYPSWDEGIDRLFVAMGVPRFTHMYCVKPGAAYLIPIEEGTRLDIEECRAYVNLSTLPRLDAKRIPSEPLLRIGGPLNMLVELWTIAADTYESGYLKKEWMLLDNLLFEARSEAAKRTLADVFIRQWAFAQEQKQIYRPSTWHALYRLIQNYESIP